MKLLNLKKELQKLRDIHAILLEKVEKLALKIEAREIVFNDKTDKWQESEKGIAYEEKTNMMQQIFDDFKSQMENLDCVIECFNELSDEE